jgi:hypothetical protein
MSRRVTLPGADELFRSTGSGLESAADMVALRPLAVAPDPATDPAAPSQPAGSPVLAGSTRSRGGVRQTPRPRNRPGQDRRSTGRERHDEKITVYLSPEELVELEHARLGMRQEHGMAVDRGRIVREALSIVLADLDARGESSTLVRRLREG